jgi:threonine/homoserine/homoserine lactone efflux protein
MTWAQSLLGFTLLAAVVALTPGLDTILVLRQALRANRRTAFAAAGGIGVGALIWGMVAAAGVAALFVASQVAYSALRWAGVVFLVYLAWGYLRAAWRGEGGAAELGAGEVDTARKAFAKGLLTDLLNPKMAVFYVTVLPLFLPTGYPPVVSGVILAGVHVAVAMVWFTVVILAAHRVRGFLMSRIGVRVVDGTAGLAMLGFGVALGLER